MTHLLVMWCGLLLVLLVLHVCAVVYFLSFFWVDAKSLLCYVLACETVRR